MSELIHTCYRLTDPERSVAFYEALGFEKPCELPIGDEAVNIFMGLPGDGDRLEGNLPPARVSARRRGGRVTGQVRDSFRHPLAGARVALQRRVGARWRAVRVGRSSASGVTRSGRPGRVGIA